jgi:phosphate transport system protein
MIQTFQTSLDEIKFKITDIFTGLLEANELILSALSDCDVTKFTDAKSRINNFTSKTNDIDNAIIKTLALFTPEARDLRQLIAYLKITNELSRASSNTKNFIRNFLGVCNDVDKDTIVEYAVPMQTSTVAAIKHTVIMIACEDNDEIQDIYNEVLIEESKTDDLYEMVERNSSLQANSSSDFEKFHKMLKALRKSGKIAARSISIANLLVYAKVGGNFRH